MDDLWKTPVTLTGKHVRLEPLALAHVPALAAIGCDDRIWELMLYGRIRTEEDMRRWVESLLNAQAAGTDLPFVAVHLASGRVAGSTRYLEMRPKHRALETCMDIRIGNDLRAHRILRSGLIRGLAFVDIVGRDFATTPGWMSRPERWSLRPP